MLTDQEFTEFVVLRGPALQRSAWFLAGSRMDGEDLLQQSLVKAYASLRRVREVGSLESYVRTIMVRTAISSGRRQWRHREFSAADLPESAEGQEVPGSPVLDGLWPLVLGLSPRQRAVVALRFYEDLSVQDTARLLGCSVGAVKKHSARAMEQLRRVMTKPQDAHPGGVR